MSENHCVVCFNKNIKIFSIGECEHPVCYECSSRMKVLCSQNECPICRHDMSMVVFTDKIQPFKNVKWYPLFDQEFKIAFASPRIQSLFKLLFINVCKQCYNQPNFDEFDELKTHMLSKHNRYCCELCIEHLKIFPKEQRWYTKNELVRHKLTGDPDNTSHRGHPLCKFCNIRFLDNDELYRHLRRTHLYCHICDAEGVQGFYREYASLRNHFKTEHYLCEQGNCSSQEFTTVFASELDLQAHQVLTHNKNAGKRERFARLEVQITLVPRPGDRNATNGRMNNNEPRVETEEFQEQITQQPQSQTRPTWLDSTPSLEQAFPALGRGPAIPIQRSTFVKRPTNRLAITDQNFPALSSDLPSAPASSGSTSSSSTRITTTVSNSATIPTLSYTSSTVRMNPKPQKKRVVNSLHINPSSNENKNASNSNNNNNNNVNTSVSTSLRSPESWAVKIKNEQKKTIAVGNKDNEKSNRITDKGVLQKQEFPALGSNDKKRNKKSSVTMQIDNTDANSNNNNNNNISKSDNKATDWSDIFDNSSKNQKKSKTKSPSSDNGNYYARDSNNQNNINNKDNNISGYVDSNITGKSKNDAANDGRNRSNNNDDRTSSTVVNSEDKSKIKKKCSLVALVNDDEQNDDSILINFHSHNRARKQKTTTADNGIVKCNDASKRNKPSNNRNGKNDEIGKFNSSAGWSKLKEEIHKSNNSESRIKSNNDRKKTTSNARTIEKSNAKINESRAQIDNNNKYKNSNDNNFSNVDDKYKNKSTTNNISNSSSSSNSSISRGKSKNDINDKTDNRDNKTIEKNKETIQQTKSSTSKAVVGYQQRNSASALSDEDCYDRPPPGIKSAPVLSIPPGFSNALTINNGNDLTFTNSQGQSFVMNNYNALTNMQQQQLPFRSSTAASIYVQPPNFYARNKELLDRISNALKVSDVERLKDFQNISLLFRDNFITGYAYYKYCKDNIQTNRFDDLFIDLVVLLPDIFKQRELWALYCADLLPESFENYSRITTCTTCSQILTKQDADLHLAEHK